MKPSTLHEIKACVFDAYGTLFDVHSAVALHTHRMANASAVSMLWRTKQLEYTWLRTLMGRYIDFWEVTGDALDFALDTSGISDSQLRDDLLQAYLSLSCYSEVPEVLEQLKKRHIRCAILSNGSRRCWRPLSKMQALNPLLMPCCRWIKFESTSRTPCVSTGRGCPRS